MNNTLSILVALAVGSLIVFTNCKSTTSEEATVNPVETGWASVMSVHDEIMLTTLMLPPVWEKLDTLKDNIKDTEQVEIIKQQVANLEAAHKAMYDWMEAANGIETNLMAMEEAAALKQLIDEKARIERIKKDTDTAYKNATELLSKFSLD